MTLKVLVVLSIYLWTSIKIIFIVHYKYCESGTDLARVNHGRQVGRYPCNRIGNELDSHIFSPTITTMTMSTSVAAVARHRINAVK